MLTYDEYSAFYRDKGRFPDGSHVPKKPCNGRQLRSKYDRYLKSLEKASLRRLDAIERGKEGSIEKKGLIDERWERCKEIVDMRDFHSCRLYNCLSDEEKYSIRGLLKGRMKTIDRAHVFRRSGYRHMRYMTENIYCLYRLFHSRLDSYKDPLTGNPIDDMMVRDWWIRIIGMERYEWLEDVAKRGGSGDEQS